MSDGCLGGTHGPHAGFHRSFTQLLLYQTSENDCSSFSAFLDTCDCQRPTLAFQFEVQGFPGPCIPSYRIRVGLAAAAHAPTMSVRWPLCAIGDVIGQAGYLFVAHTTRGGAPPALRFYMRV